MTQTLDEYTTQVIYSDLPGLGYNVELLEKKQHELKGFLIQFCNGCEGTAKPRSIEPKNGKMRTLTKQERLDFYRNSLEQQIELLPSEDKARILQALLAK